jgi:thioredoxin 1
MIRHIAEHEFEMLVLQSDKNLVIVDFWAPWCKPCQAMEPILDSISRRFTTQLDIIKVNVDDEPRIAQASNVTSIPTMVFYKKGQAVKVEFGAKDENHLTGVITELLK